MSRYGTATYTSPAEDALARAKATADEEREIIRKRHEHVAKVNARSVSATKSLFSKTDAQHRLDNQVHANLTTNGVKDLPTIRAEQEKAQEIVRAGGHALPAPRGYFSGLRESVAQVRSYRKSALQR